MPTTATPSELVRLNAGYNPTWTSQGQYNSSSNLAEPEEGKAYAIVWDAVFVTGNSISISIDTRTAAEVAAGASLTTITQAFSSDSTTTLEALRDQLRAADHVLYCVSASGGSTPTLYIGFEEGVRGRISSSGISITGGASQATDTLTELSTGVDVSAALVACVAIEYEPNTATRTVDAVAYAARGAYPGDAGHAITIQHVIAGTSTALSVGVSGTAITVNVATDGGGSPTSTATEVVAALRNSYAAMLLVAASTSSGATVMSTDDASPVALSSGGALTYTGALWGFSQNDYRWHHLPGGDYTAVGRSEAFRVAVGGYERLAWLPSAFSASDGAITVRVGPMGDSGS